jgi:hypothetical protein
MTLDGKINEHQVETLLNLMLMQKAELLRKIQDIEGSDSTPEDKCAALFKLINPTGEPLNEKKKV